MKTKIIAALIIFVLLVGCVYLYVINTGIKKELSNQIKFSNTLAEQRQMELENMKAAQENKIKVREEIIDSLRALVINIDNQRKKQIQYYKNEISKTNFTNNNQRTRYADSLSNLIK